MTPKKVYNSTPWSSVKQEESKENAINLCLHNKKIKEKMSIKKWTLLLYLLNLGLIFAKHKQSAIILFDLQRENWTGEKLKSKKYEKNELARTKCKDLQILTSIRKV